MTSPLDHRFSAGSLELALLFTFALIQTGLANSAEAIDYLYKAFEERFIWLVYLKVDPVFKRLRGESAFNELVAQMQFTQPQDYLLASP